MTKKLLKNATLVSEGRRQLADVLIDGAFISKIDNDISDATAEVSDLQGAYLIPGCIDNQVHFREPGLTHKGTIESGSRAALAGGITTFMEQPIPTLRPPLLRRSKTSLTGPQKVPT